MTHSELVERAARWLANSMRCPVVITEMSGQAEEPDAIGWTHGGGSILLECKATKSDFNADRHKAGRRTPSQFGMGNRRFYLVPPDLVDHVKANRPEQWGILVAYKTRVETKVTGEWIKQANKTSEMGLLISGLRRLAGEKQPLKGVNIRYYTIDGDQRPTATIGIDAYDKEEDLA
ncbi:hypothetical protein LCGC14_2191540 [marine sediment metagenome]|uniref:Uncharacterized protein n=1 Tax=marine sediment metagenome TaxID=412755 RepID=A0A0F9FWU5_9ZZZZ